MPGSGEMNELAGTVQESVYIGVSTQYLVETPVGGIRMLVHNDGVGQRFTVGECVVVSWNAASTFVVDGS
jgi:spermidine/putrescine transport system ATP-binding protein